MTPWLVTLSLALVAVLGFAAKRRIRALYAPPHGHVALALTWMAAAALCCLAYSLRHSDPLGALGVFSAGLFAAMVATVLWREERNRTRGMPDEFVAIPRAASARAPAAQRGGAPLMVLAGLGCLCGGFATAAVRGRLPLWLRKSLGAQVPEFDGSGGEGARRIEG